MKRVSFLACMVLLVPLLSSAFAVEIPGGEGFRFDFNTVLSMDEISLWCGGTPGDTQISTNGLEGSGCLETTIDIDADEYTRIEHIFVTDYRDVGAYLHATNTIDKDLSETDTILFAVKADLNAPASLVFRIWDRTGGWLEWHIMDIQENTRWQRVELKVPDAMDQIDMKRIGGVLFEVRPGGQHLRGKLWLDDLRLSPDRQVAQNPAVIPYPNIDYLRPIHSVPVANPHPAPDIHFITYCHILDELNAFKPDEAIEKIRQSMNRYRGMNNIEIWFYTHFYGIKPGTEEHTTKMNRARHTLLKVARWCEANHVPFYQGLGHITPITIKAPLLAEILDAAPTYCKGAFMHEYSPESNNQVGELYDILEVLDARDKVVILNNQSCYWFGLMLPPGDKFRANIFQPRFKDNFVPLWENLLPCAQGLSLAGNLGFWRSGWVDRWGISAQSWTYANLNYGSTSEMPAHWWLRMFVSAIGYGANYIEIEPDWPFDGGHIEMYTGYTGMSSFLHKGKIIDPTPHWQSSEPMLALRWVQRLIDNRAIIPAAGPDYVASLSPVAFQAVHTEYWRQWGIFERGVDEIIDQSHCPQNWEMSCQLPRRDVFRKLYRSLQHYDQTIPHTPYGLISALPPEAAIPNVRTILTDGMGIVVDEEWIAPEKAEPIARKAFIDAARKLLFTAEDCTISAIEVGEREWLVYMLDPEERFPIGVHTQLKVNVGGSWKAWDAITMQDLKKSGSGIPVQIEPGGFRLIRISKNKSGWF